MTNNDSSRVIVAAKGASLKFRRFDYPLLVKELEDCLIQTLLLSIRLKRFCAPTTLKLEFFALVQEKYKTLIQSNEATPLTMLQALQAAMAENPVLAKISFVSP
jgi:hypothetical protein